MSFLETYNICLINVYVTVLYDFVLTLYKLYVKTKKIVLGKTWFRRGFELLKTHVIYKEKSRASKIKSGAETSMI